MRRLAVVLHLHRAVELAQRIHHDLIDDRLDGRGILGRRILEDPRDDEDEIRGRTDRRGDALGQLAGPVRPHDHVEAGLGAVLLADPADLVGALVVHRVDVEAVAEVRHLDHRRLLVERGEPCPVGDVLVGTDDEGLVRLEVVGQHLVVADRRDRHDAAQQSGRGCFGKRRTAVVRVHHRIAPQVGHAADELDIRVGHRVAGNRAGNLGCRLRDRHLHGSGRGSGGRRRGCRGRLGRAQTGKHQCGADRGCGEKSVLLHQSGPLIERSGRVSWKGV